MMNVLAYDYAFDNFGSIPVLDYITYLCTHTNNNPVDLLV